MTAVAATYLARTATGKAACETADPDMWFEATPSYDPQTAVWLCRGCPVRQPCLNLALDAEGGVSTRHRHGIFGGLTPGQRWALQHSRP